MRIEEKGGDFIITDFSEAEAYKIACKIEGDGIHFYKKLLEKTKNDKSKKILNILLKEEEQHLKFFEELLFEFEEKDEDPWEGDDLLSTIDYGIFRPYEDADELETILNDPRKAAHLGLIIEDKSIGFYEVCKSKVSDEKAKIQISNIIEEETKHKDLLNDILGNI